MYFNKALEGVRIYACDDFPCNGNVVHGQTDERGLCHVLAAVHHQRLCVCVCVCVCVFVCVCVCTRARTHTHIQTIIHAYTYIYLAKLIGPCQNFLLFLLLHMRQAHLDARIITQLRPPGIAALLQLHKKRHLHGKRTHSRLRREHILE